MLLRSGTRGEDVQRPDGDDDCALVHTSERLEADNRRLIARSCAGIGIGAQVSPGHVPRRVGLRGEGRGLGPPTTTIAYAASRANRMGGPPVITGTVGWRTATH
jgi:hypothetical protein